MSQTEIEQENNEEMMDKSASGEITIWRRLQAAWRQIFSRQGQLEDKMMNDSEDEV
ncbi:MAG: hypothetical protein WAV40_01510 [Microgenomates group bacterium]